MKHLFRNIIFILGLAPLGLLGQNKLLSGRITDMSGRPIASASVTIVQTNIGTSTDVDGQFKIDVPAGATLSISSTGYKTQTISTGSGDNLQVKLEEDFARLDEVVVTGLATNV